MVRLLPPPNADNEDAADHLRVHIGADAGAIEWAVVRSDALVDEGEITGPDEIGHYVTKGQRCR